MDIANFQPFLLNKIISFHNIYAKFTNNICFELLVLPEFMSIPVPCKHSDQCLLPNNISPCIVSDMMTSLDILYKTCLILEMLMLPRPRHSSCLLFLSLLNNQPVSSIVFDCGFLFTAMGSKVNAKSHHCTVTIDNLLSNIVQACISISFQT